MRRSIAVKLSGGLISGLSSRSMFHCFSQLPTKYNAVSLGYRRMFSASSDLNVGDEFVNINWKKLKDGSVLTTKCRIGENIMRAAHANDIEIEGACEGVCACSTCHVILEDKVFDALPEASEREEDMLDQAFGLTSSSRLGCQVVLEKRHNNMTVVIPTATRNFYVDGHKPKHH